MTPTPIPADLLLLPAVRATAEARRALGPPKHFTLDPAAWPALLAFSLRLLERDIGLSPASLSAIPPHSRLRSLPPSLPHMLSKGLEQVPETEREKERTRRILDLCIVSVLVDAGSGPKWRFTSKDGTIYTRTEGLGTSLSTLLPFFLSFVPPPTDTEENRDGSDGSFYGWTLLG